MNTLATALRYEMLFVLTAFTVVISYRLLTQQININGLLVDKMSGRAFSPGRLQMLVVTLSIAIYYVAMVFESQDTGKLPNVPHEFLLALGGSHAFYLSGKLYGLLASRLGFASPKIRERFQPTSKHGG
jgi:hypothetical protein